MVMRRYMKEKINFYILIFMFIILFFPSTIYASTIYNIDVDINIDQNGDALITEIWDVKATEGTEWYKQIFNLKNSVISNCRVYMDGNELKSKNWDADESLTEKAGYYGINYTSNGVELCFGKTDYERHTFKLVYSFSNIIFNTSDSQIFYNTVIPSLPDVDFNGYSIKISGYYSFSDELNVWGFGNKGYTYVENGIVKSTMGEYKIDENLPVVILIKFPLNTFGTLKMVENYNNFNDVYNAAMNGSYNYDYDLLEEIMGNLFAIIITAISILVCVFSIKNISDNKYGYNGNKVIDKKNIPMFRELPCERDIYYANALIKLNNFGYNESNILGAIILKWVRNNKIMFRNQTTGIFNKETSVIDLTMNPLFDNELETKLFKVMLEASKDGLLETKEFEKWCSKNYDSFLGLFNRFVNDSINSLKLEGHIYRRINKKDCKKKNVMDDKIYNDSIQLYGLKKYLEEFSRIDTKEVMEVKLWDEYLMFAYLFGIADKVAKQLKDMYPDVATEMQRQSFDYDTLVFVNNISTRSFSAASSARAAAKNYSAGGGGFNIGGGGGGSIGGGGLGGSR